MRYRSFWAGPHAAPATRRKLRMISATTLEAVRKWKRNYFRATCLPRCRECLAVWQRGFDFHLDLCAQIGKHKTYENVADFVTREQLHVLLFFLLFAFEGIGLTEHAAFRGQMREIATTQPVTNPSAVANILRCGAWNPSRYAIWTNSFARPCMCSQFHNSHTVAASKPVEGGFMCADELATQQTIYLGASIYYPRHSAFVWFCSQANGIARTSKALDSYPYQDKLCAATQYMPNQLMPISSSGIGW